MKKVITQGPKKGCCNICGLFGDLTQDHVPPKGSLDPKKVGIRNLVQTVDNVHPQIARSSQNGVKFRSLCSECNNVRLGGSFDPALNQFSRQFSAIIRNRSQLLLPPKVAFRVQAQRVARAVVGHLLAAEIRQNMALPPVLAPMRNSMRKYFLDSSSDFPEELNLYFWPYRAKRHAILKGVGLMSGEHIVVGDFLKYFPVAFWLTHEAPFQIQNCMRDREIPVRGAAIDDYRIIDVPTSTQKTFRENWPEVPDDNEAIIVNNDLAFIAESLM
jgi:hypothetical protein